MQMLCGRSFWINEKVQRGQSCLMTAGHIVLKELALKKLAGLKDEYYFVCSNPLKL